MRRTLFTVACTLALAACSKGGSSAAASRINEASIEKAKALVAAPQPLADVRPKLVEVLGEPTATDGESLIWAGVTGNECRELTLVVQGGEVKGTMGGMANKMVASEFDKCAKRAGGK